MNRREKGLFALLVAAAAILFTTGLGSTGLWAPDEPRFAAVAEELRQLKHGAESLVVLRLSDVPYTQKPPLYYWGVAALSAFEGRVSEVTARLPGALAGIGCVALTVVFGTALSRRPAVGLWSGAVLLTVFRFAHLARRAQLDVILTFFVLLALFLLYRLREAPTRRGRDFLLLHAALALGVLTKGPVALLPIPAFALFLAWQGRLRDFSRVFPWWSFAISLGPAGLWIASAVALAPAGFFGEAVVDNVFARFFSGTAHVRPFYYYFVHFPLEFLPWTLLWPAAAVFAAKQLRGDAEPGQRDAVRWLVTFIALGFVFFSLSAGKRGLYLLPTYPAVALLCGLAIDDALRRATRVPRLASAGLGAGGLLCLGFAGHVLVHDGLALERYPGFALPAAFGAALVLIVVGCAVAALAARQTRAPLAARLLPALVGVFALELLVFTVAYPAFDPEKSPEPIARAAAAMSQNGAPIGVFDHTALKGGIAFYSGHPVVDIRSEESLRAFLAGGGEAIIVKARKFERVPQSEGFEVRASFRSGKRRLVVIAPIAAAASRPRPGPADPNQPG